MSDQQQSDIELLSAAYAAFNSRNIDAALACMVPNVEWPKAFKGGFAQGHQEVRAYSTEQCSEIKPRVEPTSFHAEAAGVTLVRVHQVVRDMKGAILFDGEVGHRFTIVSGLIQKMEVCPVSATESVD